MPDQWIGGGFGFRPHRAPGGAQDVPDGVTVSLNGFTARAASVPPVNGDVEVTLALWTGWVGGKSVTTDSQPAPSGDGTLDGPPAFGGKTITLSGLVLGDYASRSSEGIDRVGEQLSGLLSGSVRTAEMRVTQPSLGLTRIIGVRSAQDPDFEALMPWVARWSLYLHAEDPLRYEVGSLRWGIGETVTVTNRGNAISRPMLDFYGPLVNPWFEAGGNRFSLRTTIPAGQVLTANCRTRRVTRNDLQTFTPVTAAWHHVQPGKTPFTFGADSGTGRGEMRRFSAWM